MRKRKENRRPLPRRAGWRDMPDKFWAKAEPLLWAAEPQKTTAGRKPLEKRRVFNGILYVLRTGCQWKMMPREYGSGSSCHRYFQQWARKGVFGKLWQECLREYDDLKGIAWRWQSLDSATVQAPVKRGSRQGKTPRIGVKAAPSGISW
jgi:transposase